LEEPENGRAEKLTANSTVHLKKYFYQGGSREEFSTDAQGVCVANELPATKGTR